jgi:hypothetical protein
VNRHRNESMAMEFVEGQGRRQAACARHAARAGVRVCSPGTAPSVVGFQDLARISAHASSSDEPYAEAPRREHLLAPAGFNRRIRIANSLGWLARAFHARAKRNRERAYDFCGQGSRAWDRALRRRSLRRPGGALHGGRGDVCSVRTSAQAIEGSEGALRGDTEAENLRGSGE